MRIFVTILFLGVSSFCNAQFLNNLGKRAERAAERTIERRVEREAVKSTDRVLDSVVDAPKNDNNTKAKKKPSNKAIIGEDLEQVD